MATITVQGFCAGGGHVRLTVSTARRGSHTFSLDVSELRDATRAQLRAAIEAATFLEPD